MEAIYCDRCKKLFKKSETNIVELNLGYTENLTGDLCNKCRDIIEADFYGDKIKSKKKVRK